MVSGARLYAFGHTYTPLFCLEGLPATAHNDPAPRAAHPSPHVQHLDTFRICLLTFSTRGNTLLDMGDSGSIISINADALEYGLQKFLKLFGKDRANAELTEWFTVIRRSHTRQLNLVEMGNLPCK
jgi:hypothetical protein